jgi:CRP-like cAMP-binding protein/CheY-like chemotaxis protein
MIQIGEILKQVPFFRSLGRDSIDFITERLKFKQFKSNSTICKVGDPGDKMYIVLSGKVAVTAANGEVLAYIASGNYFGEMSLLTGEPRSATIMTVEDTETFVLEKEDFDVILDKYPSISIAMSKIMSQRLRDTNKVISEKAKELKTSSTPAGPAGSLKDKHITEVIAFCESNSLTGTLEVTSGPDKAVVTFEKGVLQNIKLRSLGDDEALDMMMGWEDGQFVIKPKIISFEEKKAEQSHKTGNVLVINHSMVVRKLIERNLTSIGHKVLTAGDITEGIAALKKGKPNVIISDSKYDEVSGFDFCRQIREDSAFQDIPFIFITDSSTDDDVIGQLKGVANAALVDSQDANRMADAVAKLL